MLYSKRNLEVREMRKKGMKLREIGEKTGLTTERVRQICVALDLREQPTDDPMYNALEEAATKMGKSPVRAYNCLHRVGIYTLEDAAKYTDEQLLRIRNLGQGSLDIIREAQAVLGLPELFPCPFCGEQPEFVWVDDWCVLRCFTDECAFIQSDSYSTEAEAIKAWNTRCDCPNCGAKVVR